MSVLAAAAAPGAADSTGNHIARRAEMSAAELTAPAATTEIDPFAEMRLKPLERRILTRTQIASANRIFRRSRSPFPRISFSFPAKWLPLAVCGRAASRVRWRR